MKLLALPGVFQEFLNSYLPEYALVATIKLEYGKYDQSIKDFPRNMCSAKVSK